ncbi:MAG: hypothetical protein WCZ87_11800, partial [Thiohalobacteraceae bacterium]
GSSEQSVIPAQAGIHVFEFLDSRFRGNDETGIDQSFLNVPGRFPGPFSLAPSPVQRRDTATQRLSEFTRLL